MKPAVKSVQRSLRKSARGFTLLETVIAMVIMAGALVLLSNSWGGSFMRIRKTQQAFEVAAMLERKMNDIEIEYRGKSLDEIPDEKEGDFGSEYSQYTWKLKSRKLEFPDVSSALTAQQGGAGTMLMSMVKQLSEYIGKAVKEVTVTVVITQNKKPLEFSVTTYFVDYDKEMSFGMPSGL
ncbi:MAG: type II secretion system protein [Bdellovibrio sp.]|jgi:general secretion pathway protein I